VAAIRIYTDENVNPAVAEGLRRRGIDASSAIEVGNVKIDDEAQMEYATREQAVLFTHDTDLLVISRRWMEEDRKHWGVIYIHQDSLSIGECIRRLKDYADILEAEDMINRVEFL
jgi:predicted nuclease of predicted toxin-antitoxin system